MVSDPTLEDRLTAELDRLYRLAFRLTGTRADAEDLVQDTFVRAINKRESLDAMETIGPWLGRVLYNRFIDLSRRFERQRLALVRDAGENSQPPDTAPAAELEVERQIDITRIRRGVDQLSLEHRAVLLMFDAEGYKLTEIQEITGVELGTLKSRLHRARARLREILVSDGTL